MKTRLIAVLGLFFLCTMLPLPAGAEPVAIRILHVNDFHGFAEPSAPPGASRKVGGIAWLAGEADRLRTEKPTLFLAAGDMIQGASWTNLFRGAPVIELMNLMRFDVMVVGNHEFDFGREVLRRRVAEARFPVLGANVVGLDFLKPFVIENVNGVRVAIIGVVTDETPLSTNPRNVAGLKFFPPVETLATLVPRLRESADVVIVLSHVGYQQDRLLAECVPGIDLIVGGHSHTRLETPARVGGTLIVQAWDHAKALGVVDISVDNGKVQAIDGRLVDISPDCGEADQAVLALVANYENRLEKILAGTTGYAEVPLDATAARKRETNLGDLVADIMRAVSGADAAIVNGGGIRASIPAGPILLRDIYSALPFDNYIVAVKLTGAAIRQALEHGVARLGKGSGAFPQVSGIAFSYDPAAPPGARVGEIRIGDGVLDPEREYTVATNDYLAAGGDGYTVFAEAAGTEGHGEKVVYNDSGRMLREVVAAWLKEKGTIRQPVGNRIRVVNR